MSEENGAVEKTAGMASPCNAWGVGVLYGFAALLFPLVRMLCGAASLPEWLEEIPAGILDVALGYYWAVILRNVTRDARINPAVFAVFFGLCFAADLAIDVVYGSMHTVTSVTLSHATSVVSVAGIWYMVVRVWNAAAGRNTTFAAKLAVGFLALVSILALCSFLDTSPESSSEWEPAGIALAFLVMASLYAGLQHLFNLGLRNSRIAETPEDRRCPLWKAILQGGGGALGILVAMVLAGIVIAGVISLMTDGKDLV